MIQAKVAPYPHILVVFDSPQSKVWVENGAISQDGIAAFLQRFMQAGVNIKAEVSAVCLADAFSPKAADFKAKKEYIADLIETHAFNVVVPVGAKAFEKVMGHKGIERFFGKTLKSDVYDCKVVPCPNPAMIRFKPEVKLILDDTMDRIVTEKQYPEFIEVVKHPVSYEVIDTIKKFNALMANMLQSPVVAFDLEATGFGHNTDEILMAQFTYEEYQSALIPTQWYKDADGTPTYWDDAEWDYIVGRLRKHFARDELITVGHNVKFDLKFVAHQWGVKVPKAANLADTMIMSYLLDENTPNDLKTLACQLTDLGDYEFELDAWKREYCKKNKLKVSEFSYGFIPFDIIAPYALTDTDATFRLYNQFLPLIAKEEQNSVLDMIMRFVYTTCHMELRGWPVDMEYAVKYLADLEKKIVIAEAELMKEPLIKKAERVLSVMELAKVNAKRKGKLAELKEPFKFNLRSVDQKRVLFFEIMGLPKVKFTKTKDANGKRSTPSMDKEVMEKWSFDLPKVAPFIDTIRQYAELCKMKSTYVEGIINKAVKQADGTYRIHPTYNVIGAKTGRLSSRSPNFQNLPVRNAEAKNVKRIIKAREGWVLIGADLAAAEMRWACVCSGDPKLTAIFNSGVDVHGAIACEVFNLDCDPNEVKYRYPELRDIAKTIQFLTLYGGGAETLASKVKIKPKRARAILEQVMREVMLVDDSLEDIEYDFKLLEGSTEAAARLEDMFKFPEWKAQAVVDAIDKSGALMSAFEIERNEAQDILDSYFEKYQGVKQYIADTEQFTRHHGYSLSLLGRKRRVPQIQSIDEGVAERGVRQAVNATIQSIASDGLMLSACGIQEECLDLDDSNILMMGPIHDALYFEVKEEFAKEAHDMVIKYMSQFPIPSDIPMLADAEYGRDWAHFSEDFAKLYQELLLEDEEDSEEAHD